MVRVKVVGWLSRAGRDPERELREFKARFERASREKDRATLDGMIHPDFSMVTPDGDVVSKRGVIEGIVSPGSTFMPTYDRKERTTVFTAGRDTVREIADLSIGGKIPGRGDLSGKYTHSAIFIRTERGWQFYGNTLTRKASAA
ncbi:MAG TPA: nuclear transport factor 2 family protein [Rugosimonospora sp.]|nr:nuclear transport factor 2 family protein [Rugosimonospora sp.]